MNKQPLISIIMNCFNGERYLKEAIDSIINQTYNNWEIIFWDNLSTDNSATIVSQYNEPRIRYYQSEKHTLLGEARNYALNKANAEWLAFLDVDDVWHEDKLEKQVDLINSNNKEIGFIYGRCEVIYSNFPRKNHIFKNGELLPAGDIFSQLLLENFVPFVSAIVNKEKFENLGGFDRKLQHSTDYSMFLKLAESYQVAVLQDVCCQYRVHETNLTNDLRIQGELESIAIVRSFLPQRDVKNALIYHQTGLAIAYLREGELVNFFKALLKKGVLYRFIIRSIHAFKNRVISLLT